MKDQRLTIRVSQEERERIERAAAMDHRTVSDWIRLTVVKNLKEEKKVEKRTLYSVIVEGSKVYNVYEEPYMFSDAEYRAEAEDLEGNTYTAHWSILDSWKALPDDADVGQEEACDWDNGWITK